MDEQKPKVRWFQYRLKSLFLLPVVVGIGTYWYDWASHRPPYMDYDGEEYFAACDSFVTDLTAGHLDHAYESTSPRFKTQMSRKQFESLICAFPLIRDWGNSGGQDYFMLCHEVDQVPLRSWSGHKYVKPCRYDNRSIELWVWVVLDDSFFYRRPPLPKVEEIQIREVAWPQPETYQDLKPSWEQE